MANKVFINDDGLEEMVFEGDLTAEAVKEVINDSLKFDHQLSAQNKHINTLVNLSEVTAMPAEALEAAFQGMAGTDYDRVALYGADPKIKADVSEIIKLAEVGESVKQFASREEALAWLKEGHD